MYSQSPEPLLREARRITLSGEAKARGRLQLMQLMKERPLPVSTPVTRSVALWAIFFRPAFAGALVVVMLLASGGGVVWAAERTLPGDGLYRVKTGVTEPLRTLFITDPAARVAWETERVKRRLDELDTLERENRLHDVERQILEEKLQEHVEAVETLSEEEDETEAVQEREQLRENLRGHRSIEWRQEGKRLRIKIREQYENENREWEHEEEDEDESDHAVDEEEVEEIEEDNEVREHPRPTLPSADTQEEEEEHTRAKTGSSTKSASQPTSKTTTTTSSNSGTSRSDDSSDDDGDEGDAGRDEEEDEETADTPETISESAAKSKALSVVTGTVEEAKLTTKDGKPVWEVKIERASDGETVKVIVNAVTGSIVDIDD